VKIPNLYVYSILAIGMIFSIPTLLDNVQAQTNATNATSSLMQNQTAQAAAAGQNQTAQAAAAGQNQTAQAAAAGQNQTAQAAAAGQNQTAQAAAAGQNQTMSQDAQALMALDIPEVRDNLIAAKESLANGEIADALTGVTDLENQLILLQNKTTFTEDIQKIKNAISKSDLNKALDEITNIQTGILKAETEISKAQLANPELMAAQQDEDEEE
jgi:hypothetical protein